MIQLSSLIPKIFILLCGSNETNKPRNPSLDFITSLDFKNWPDSGFLLIDQKFIRASVEITPITIVIIGYIRLAGKI